MISQFGENQIQRRHTRIRRKDNDRILPRQVVSILPRVMAGLRVLTRCDGVNQQVFESFCVPMYDDTSIGIVSPIEVYGVITSAHSFLFVTEKKALLWVVYI
jgi:hypothetical protein